MGKLKTPSATPATGRLHVIRDFAELDTKTPSEQGRDLHLEDPRTGELMYCEDGTPATIGFVGPDSDTVKIIHRRNADATNEALASTNGNGTDSRDAQDRRAIDDIASCARRWNLPKIDGEKIEFSLAAAKKLFSDPRFKWIGEQALPFVYVRRRFFAEASSN